VTYGGSLANQIRYLQHLPSPRRRVHLARLRTGHCSLNQYLHRINIEESSVCSSGNGAEERTPCTFYDKERAKLMSKVGIGGMWVERILGHTNFIPVTLDFVEETGRFAFYLTVDVLVVKRKHFS
jgi:hypothetical protein